MLPFVKMHGLGNDFVIVEKQNLPVRYDISKLAKEITHRNTGIGADQFIVYDTQGAFVNMLVYNQDGTKASACGNASRCLMSLINTKSGLREITLKIENREIPCNIVSNGHVSVNMGKVIFDEKWMLSEETKWLIAERYSLEFKEIICASIGNPHLVIFSNLSDQDMQIIGAQLQHAEFFKNGVNVNFANIMDDKISLRVWERGTGLTLACGSGACATFAAARKLGFASEESTVAFAFGDLKIKQSPSGDIIMTGPASFIAEGIFYYD